MLDRFFTNLRNVVDLTIPPGTGGGPGEPLWWVMRLSRALDNRTARLTRYQSYYEGNHNLRFATRKFRDAFGPLFSEYAENVCELVVEAVKERLTVTGFRTGDADQDKEAWRIWQANQLDAWQTVAHQTALVKEEAYLMVWADPQDASTPQITVEDPLQVVVESDPANTRRRLAALKRWYDPSGRAFVTLYLPDAIWKFQSKSTQPQLQSQGNDSPSSWEPRIVAGEPWPLPNALGLVPIVPLVNRPKLGGGGISEIKSVIPINDAINKLVSDLLLASEFSSFRQKWATNVVLEEDPDTGKPREPWSIAVDKLLTAPPPEAGEPETRFGEFGQTDLQPYVQAIEQRLQMIATITRTPAHYILGSMGTFPSGESLNATEAGLVAKARNKELFFGEGHEEAIRLAFLVNGVKLAPGQEVVWADAERRTESQHIDALVKLQTLGIPLEQLWEDAGYSPQQIQHFKDLKAAAAAQPTPPPAAAAPAGTPGEPAAGQTMPPGMPSAAMTGGA